MKKFKYIIIDDEYPSHLVVQRELKQFQNYHCIAKFQNPEKALLFLQKTEVDLIFLDIRMREMSGFQFLEALEKNIFIVILTAFQEENSLIAHQYYDKDLVFYTNKAQFSYYLPKIITRFEKMHEEKKVINRAKQLSNNEFQTFPITINKKNILLEDIVYIIVAGHHVVITIVDGEELVCRTTLRELLDILPSHIFFQVRRDTIINIGYVTAFTNSTICVEGKYFSISFRNREKVIQTLEAQKNLLYSNY